MKKIGLIGGCFYHAHCSTWWKKPKLIEFNKGKIEDITFFIDGNIVPHINTKNPGKKIAWLVEASSIIPHITQDIINHAKEVSESYDLLFTHDKRLYNLAPNFHYIPSHGYWIEEPKFYPKSKIVSMVSSIKRMCPGHDFRLNWVEKLRNRVDLYGSGFKDFKVKEEALCDYMFSVTIENSQYETYWTEKILDCFVTGTVPIYHGAQDLPNYFNMDGVIILDDGFDPAKLTPDLYISMKDAIKDNFERASKYTIIEDLIYEKYLI